MSDSLDFPTAEGLEKLLVTEPTELQRQIHEVYPHCKSYTEKQYGYTVKLDIFVTVEGHLSVHLVINLIGSEKCARVTASTTQARGMNSLVKWLIDTAMQALPLTLHYMHKV